MDNLAPFRKLDVVAFARHDGNASGTLALTELPRLATELSAGADPRTILVDWQIRAELRSNAADEALPWLLCEASVHLPLQCQRCLDGVDTRLTTHQWFRFVDSEERADLEDEEAQEDVLALSGPIDVFQLIEDDLLMALPPVAKHADCDAPGATEVKDAAFDAASATQSHPFAKLGSLPRGPGRSGGEPAD